MAAPLSGVLGFGLLVAFSITFWRLYPYPEGASPSQIKLVWAIHVMAEKLFNYLIYAICAVAAAFPVRRSWKIGLAAAIGAGVVYQIVAIGVYVVRFGLDAYLTNSRFWATMGMMIATTYVAGMLTVWRSYWVAYKLKKANKSRLDNPLSRHESEIEP